MDRPATFDIEEGEFEIQMKCDGCCNIRRNYAEGSQDYIHICDLEEFITLLSKVLMKAKELDYEV